MQPSASLIVGNWEPCKQSQTLVAGAASDSSDRTQFRFWQRRSKILSPQSMPRERRPGFKLHAEANLHVSMKKKPLKCEMKVSFRDAAAEKQSKAPWPSRTYAVALRCICHNLQKTNQRRETCQCNTNGNEYHCGPIGDGDLPVGFQLSPVPPGSTLRTGLPVCVAQQA